MKKTALIIGAGPAGLTAALELLRRSDIKPIVLEALDDVGGISRTIEYKGNRMDIGGHRFFSKSDWVMNWWQGIMPRAPDTQPDGTSRMPSGDHHLLVRPRLSRILYLRRFFDYPISLSYRTMANLGFLRIVRIGLSYVWASCFPRKPERHLEDFFRNRFGDELYRTFFRDYTEKVWGIPCREISPAWGAQRIKGLSIRQALLHAGRTVLCRQTRDIGQKSTETSLIERFLYPKYGPGQMWQRVAEQIRQQGGEIHLGQRAVAIHLDGEAFRSVDTLTADNSRRRWDGDYLVSTMAVRDLFSAMVPSPPPDIHAIADGLKYRDFITLGLLVRKLKPRGQSAPPLHLLPDTWIYIQEPDVNIGRLQLFNNWSPALVREPDSVWMGLEYFCQEGDALWNLDDKAFADMAISELTKLDLIDPADALDWHIVRVPKAYPAYFGSYGQFDRLRAFTDRITNLFLVGRNGMHRYNNQDHSMVAARLAVEAIVAGTTDKSAIWAVNLEDDYHETSSRQQDG